VRMRSEALALFPPGVTGAELLREQDAGPLLAAESASIAGAAESRRIEFAAGRHCAREALIALGEEPVAIPRRQDRQPEWPPGIVGSISHASGYCGAVVARQSTCGGLGFDVEEWGRMRPGLWRRIATPAEIAWLRAQADEGERWATLLFSAKESFYKAQYPRSATFLGFRAAVFHATAPGHFEVELLRDVAAIGSAGARFAGRYAADAERCYTGLCLPPVAPSAGRVPDADLRARPTT
jgi:4'-phosphopantetheinyl transferase EntD